MANPSPRQTEEFLARQQPIYDEPMGKTVGVRFRLPVDQYLRSLDRGGKVDFIRRAVERLIESEGIELPDTES